MRLRYLLLSAAFLAVAVPVAKTDEKPALPEGNWVLSTPNPIGDAVVCILKTETKDGKIVVSVVATPPKVEASISGVNAAGKELSFTVKSVQTFTQNGKELKSTSERKFVAAPGKNPMEILGSFGTDAFSVRAKLTATDKDAIESVLVRGPAADTMQKVQQLSLKANLAKNKVRLEKDVEKKKELRAEADDAQKEVDEKAPRLYREVVAKHAETSSAFEAAYALLAQSAKSEVTVAEGESLTKLILKQAEMYGPRFVKPTATRLAESLVRQKGLEGIALIPIEPIAKGLTDKDAASVQFDILTTYKSALEGAGKATEAKSIGARLVKLDGEMDKEYLATVPPFKPTQFAGRKDGANRVAVMELFTGAQCPPCVAADVAFDALNKSYKPSDLVLIQYHMHIPGPDPLTNADTEARWDYYREQFPEDVRGTPTSLFNGKPMGGTGGFMVDAESKFGQYRKIVDSMLEKATELKLNGKATRDGDKISIAIDLAGVESTDDLKLRLLVVEDTIKYVGGNKLRFHHHVVRAMPGGIGGVAVKASAMKHTATADVAAIRKDLVKYLDEFSKDRPFPYPTVRPLDLKDLKVIALVQNDKTREILQAVQIEVDGK